MIWLWLLFFAQFLPYPGSVAPIGGDTIAVTGQTLGTARSNYTGCVGFSFTAGAGGQVVTTLGRWVISGNSGTHLLVLVGPADAQEGSCSVNTSGQPAGAYLYCTLGSPFTLTGGGDTYRVVSQETNGGDQWYDDDTTITTTAAFTIGGSSVGTTSGSTCVSNGGNLGSPHAYVPTNFKYH